MTHCASVSVALPEQPDKPLKQLTQAGMQSVYQSQLSEARRSQNGAALLSTSCFTKQRMADARERRSNLAHKLHSHGGDAVVGGRSKLDPSRLGLARHGPTAEARCSLDLSRTPDVTPSDIFICLASARLGGHRCQCAPGRRSLLLVRCTLCKFAGQDYNMWAPHPFKLREADERGRCIEETIKLCLFRYPITTYGALCSVFHVGNRSPSAFHAARVTYLLTYFYILHENQH